MMCFQFFLLYFDIIAEVILIVGANINFVFFITLWWRWQQLQLFNGSSIQGIGISIAWTRKHIGISMIIWSMKIVLKIVFIFIGHLIVD